jgi:DTW domain-containing protein YfiP
LKGAEEIVPRAVCMRCRRPESVCYCAHIAPRETKTRVIVLQHPRERDVPIGTARIASLCLPRSELYVGVTFDHAPAIERLLADDARPAALLFPGPGAIDVAREPPRGPITLFVVDGTWWQAKKLLKENPRIAALPRYAFTPSAPSEYLIRREPSEECLSTIEALAHVLSVLEGDAAFVEAMLAPFRAMVGAQVRHQRASRARTRHAKKSGPRPTRLPPLFRDRAADLVCVAGEGNAWPYRREQGQKRWPDELVHLVARRASTGETTEIVIAPNNPLAPSTPPHTGLTADELRAGCTREGLVERWSQFVRPTDVLAFWGHYGADLFASAGGKLSGARVDLRHVARSLERGEVGTLDAYATSLGWNAERDDLSRPARVRDGS